MLCNVSKYKTHYFYFGVNTSHSVMGIIIQAKKLSVVWYFSPSFYPLYLMCHHHFPIIFWRAHCSLSCDRMHHLVPSTSFFFISCFFFSIRHTLSLPSIIQVPFLWNLICTYVQICTYFIIQVCTHYINIYTH